MSKGVKMIKCSLDEKEDTVEVRTLSGDLCADPGSLVPLVEKVYVLPLVSQLQHI
jgi:hypothetical protein